MNKKKQNTVTEVVTHRKNTSRLSARVAGSRGNHVALAVGSKVHFPMSKEVRDHTNIDKEIRLH